MKEVIISNYRFELSNSAQNALQFALRQPKEFFDLVFCFTFIVDKTVDSDE